MLFYRDRISEVRRTFESKGLDFDKIAPVSSIQQDELDPTLYEILVDVRCLTSLLNTISPGLILDTNSFLEIIISICSRLIRYHPLQDYKQISSQDAVYHTGLTIFMMTSFLQLDGRQILRYDLVTKRLKEVLSEASDEVEDSLALWFMIIGGIWLSGGSDGEWLAPRIRDLAEKMGFDAWSDVLKIVRQYPWIGILHDEPGSQLWSKISGPIS
jgi:hypothetical protein